MESLDRHQTEILQNQQYMKDKPILGVIYQDFHLLISSFIPDNLPGKIIEIGSGAVDITRVIPDCLRTDLFPNPWIDQTENAYALSFPDRSVAAVILFDVFHHLRYPGTALTEIQRVLLPGGRVILFEPGMSLLGRLIYGIFHPEPIGFEDQITWFAPDDWIADQDDYYAAQGNAHRIFLDGEGLLDKKTWKLIQAQRIASLSYVASGGFSGPQLYPRVFYPVMKTIDKMASLFPGIFATRLLVVLEKKP